PSGATRQSVANRDYSKGLHMADRKSFAGFAVVSFAMLFGFVPASAQSNVADLDIVFASTVSPNPALPGSPIQYTVEVVNRGPHPSLEPGVITGTLPAGVTPSSCVAKINGAFLDIVGTCVIDGQSVTATLPQGIYPYATTSQVYFLFIFATLTPSAPTGGAVYSATFSVSASSSDPNPANNSTTLIFTTPAPLSITVNPKQLTFGVAALNHQSSARTVSVTNSGKSAFGYQTPTVTGDFAEVDNSCTGSHLPGFTTSAFVTPGTTCVSTLIFQHTSLGTEN